MNSTSLSSDKLGQEDFNALGQIIDLQSRQEMFGDLNVFLKCFKVYAEDYKQSFVAVHQAWRSQDIEQCLKELHRFRGVSMYTSSTALVKALKDCL